MTTLAQTLARLFAEKTLVTFRRPMAPYDTLAPGVRLGFEPSARVEVETRPKDDFTRSPDQSLVTVAVDCRGPSRWLTLEAEFDWEELAGTEQFQVGLYARPDRTVSCRAVLRLPGAAENGEDFEDVTLCELELTREGRSAHGQGRFGVEFPAAARPSGPPKLLIFFGTGDDLHVDIDYLIAYFT